jgi:hypothetical protein
MRDICSLKSGSAVKTSFLFYSVTKLKKKISLIRSLSILKISQPEHGFRFILVTLYTEPSATEKTVFIRGWRNN